MLCVSFFLFFIQFAKQHNKTIYSDIRRCVRHTSSKTIDFAYLARTRLLERKLDGFNWLAIIQNALWEFVCMCVYVNVNVIGIEDAIIFAKTTQMPFFPQSSSPAVQQQQQSHQNSIQITHRFGKSAGKDTPHPLH